MKIPVGGAARRTALLGLLSALALALSFLEGLLPPLPVPGARLGLSNLVIMYALSALGLPSALAITAVKTVFVLLVRGGTAFVMSFAGGMLSALVMAAALWLLRGRVSFIAIGILGAVTHNAAQLAAAMLLMGTALLAYAPWLLLAALGTGTLTGFVTNVTLPLLKRFSDQQ